MEYSLCKGKVFFIISIILYIYYINYTNTNKHETFYSTFKIYVD